MTKRETRIAAFVASMRGLAFKRGETAKHAEQWGVSEATIERDVAEAWKRVAAEVMDPDVCGATVCVALEDVILKARGEGGAAARRAIVDAARAWAAITLGQKVDVDLEFRDEKITAEKARLVMREIFTGRVGPPADDTGEASPPTPGPSGRPPPRLGG